ncbi:nif11-like leader peptide domain protein [Synechococcus sp. BIOS-E4-1]|uniref:Nif11-like leader peptide family natural product precursor n=1 Tax=Synechococcus sp. BIOS-E4-1 TaxID=1400864 RepID=UPI0016494537|nr:Nif11-like leader peptide family natural product precursor [Synechococcus sp. BIOS-E4-1]QNI54399.1 nif11-like leader peptide domain protein [Synechococcus sp. BIOS-E4-1]
MSEEQLKAFLEKVNADTTLQEKLKAAAVVDAVLDIAKVAGLTISADDVRTEISEEELERAAAGGDGENFTLCNRMRLCIVVCD